MKKTTIQILSAILALCLLLTAAPLAGFAKIELPEFSFAKLLSVFSRAAEIVDSGTYGNNLTWTLDRDGTLTISGIGPMESYQIYEDRPWNDKQDLVTSVVIQSGVTTIGENAFVNFSNMSNISIPDSILSIGKYAFSCCTSLTVITVPRSVTFIAPAAFDSCSLLAEIIVHAENSVYHSVGNCLIETKTKKLIAGIKTSRIPSDGSVTSIGESAFLYCYGLTYIKIPDTVTSIGNTAFAGCPRLHTVILSTNTVSIGDGAFNGCDKLIGITIPSSVTYIGNDIFGFCTSLTKITVNEENPIYHSAGNCLIETKTKKLVAGCSTSRIPSDGSVTSIDDSAFFGCINLTSVTIPDCVTHIGAAAFFYCNGLTTISIPDGITTIEEDTFAYCKDLTSIMIPQATAFIGEGAFESCSSLQDVYYTGSEAQWKKIEIEPFNDSLLHANIHYNTSGSGDTPGGCSIDGIESLYPENGCKDFDYKNGAVLLITFKEPITRLEPDSAYDLSAKLNFAAGNIRIYSAGDHALLWEAHENVYRPGFCSDISVNKSDPNTLYIRPSTMDFSFDYMTHYYVTVDPGFVCFDSGNTSPGISKGQWRFSTRSLISGNTIENISTRNNFVYDDSFFSLGSDGYHHDFAKFALNTTTAVGVSDEDYRTVPLYAKSFFWTIGFGDDDGEAFRAYGYDKKTTNSIACCIADKNLQEKDETLIIVAVRGAGYMWEWGGNFNVGNQGNHSGFTLARNGVLARLNDYIAENKAGFQSKIKLLVTGYSRAGATANLTAAALDDMIRSSAHTDLCSQFYDILIGKHGFSQSDLYAYTFEAPLCSIDKNTKTARYQNIFNIVNPIDIVPKLAPTAWGFSRYGTDCYLPSAETSGQYKTYLNKMQKAYQYTAYGDNYEEDFTFYEISIFRNAIDELFGAPFSITRENKSIKQGAFIDMLLRLLACDVIGSRDIYTNKYQHAIMSLVPSFLCGKGIKIGNTLLGSMTDYMEDHQIDMAFNPFNLLYHIKSMCVRSIAENLVIDNPNIDNNITEEEISALLGELDDIMIALLKHIDLAFTTFMAFGNQHSFADGSSMTIMMLPHYSQVTTAWMESIAASDLKFETSSYRIVKYDCPVNISVYDSKNELCAQITDDEVQYIENSTISAYINNDGSKCFILPDDEEYSFKITGTDDGVLNCSVTDYDFSAMKDVNVKNYYNLPVITGTEYTAVLHAMGDADTISEYALTDQNGKIIECDAQFAASEIPEYTVTVTTKNAHGKILGGGIYNEGQFAKVQAFPDSCSVFEGWYDGDNLISKDCDYRFGVKKDTVLSAVFSEAHLFEEKERVAPTCKAEGYIQYICARCGTANTEKTAKLTEHTWSSGEITTPATCKAAGVKTFTCSVCGATKTEAIPKLTAHTWDAGEITKPATCKDAGVKTFTCTVCGATKTEAIPKLTAHTWNDGEITKPATVTDAGEKTFTCTVCGATKTEAIPKLTPETPQYTLGDVNGDGKVTAADARLALRRAVGLETYEAGSVKFLACDVDGNGKVTAADARKILRAAVGLEKLS